MNKTEEVQHDLSTTNDDESTSKLLGKRSKPDIKDDNSSQNIDKRQKTSQTSEKAVTTGSISLMLAETIEKAK